MGLPKKNKFELKPLPIESEFRLLSIKQRIADLTREDMEEFLIESLTLTMKLADQVRQFHAYVDRVEGKTD
jgi:hypothetical protein